MLHFFMAAPYVGIQGGLAHIKRKLDLDEDCNSDADTRTGKPKIETDLEDSKVHGLYGGHIGYTYFFGKPFVGIEGYAGTHFGGDLFKPQFSFGAKGVIGVSIASNLLVYAGAGVDFTRFKSLKISSKIAPNEKKSFDLKKLTTEAETTDIDYHISPAFLGTIGAKYFIAKNISIGADMNVSFRKEHTFEPTQIYASGLQINTSDTKDSTEKYRSIQALLKISYHFGGNAQC